MPRGLLAADMLFDVVIGYQASVYGSQGDQVPVVLWRSGCWRIATHLPGEDHEATVLKQAKENHDFCRRLVRSIFVSNRPGLVGGRSVLVRTLL